MLREIQTHKVLSQEERDMKEGIVFIYTLIYVILGFKHDVLITEKPLRGVFNKVLSSPYPYVIITKLKFT